jgi:GTP cyclohydrolase II
MLTEVARVPLPTRWGVFDVRAFESPTDHVYLAMVRGDVERKDGVLVRLHSECLTGDALGSLRCDCGVQLRLAMRRIAAEDCGVLVYATGHEGRGVGLINKLRTYVEQDKGHDTLDANLRLGLPVDGRTYDNAAAVLSALDLRSVRLLTNNPRKVDGMRRAGIDVVAVEPLPTAPHARNLGYLRTKERRMDHVGPTGLAVTPWESGRLPAVDASALLGEVRAAEDRPYVVLKFAQTLDGRIATSTGDAKWISGEAERRISHALRAACDAVLVGVGTVMTDDPLLTVRLVAGASPLRVVLDSTLRLPPTAQILGPDAATTVITTRRASAGRRTALHERGVRVHVVPSRPPRHRPSCRPGPTAGGWHADAPRRGRRPGDHVDARCRPRRSPGGRDRTDDNRSRHRGSGHTRDHHRGRRDPARRLVGIRARRRHAAGVGRCALPLSVFW